jgi:hypothetical protein
VENKSPLLRQRKRGEEGEQEVVVVVVAPPPKKNPGSIRHNRIQCKISVIICISEVTNSTGENFIIYRVKC